MNPVNSRSNGISNSPYTSRFDASTHSPISTPSMNRMRASARFDQIDRWRNLSPRGNHLSPSQNAIRKAANQVQRYTTQIFDNVRIGLARCRRGRGGDRENNTVKDRIYRSNDRYIANRTSSQSSSLQPLSASPSTSDVSFESSTSQTNAIPKGALGSLSDSTNANSNVFKLKTPSFHSSPSIEEDGNDKDRLLNFSSSSSDDFKSSNSKQRKPIPPIRSLRKLPFKPEKALDAIGIVQNGHSHVLDWGYQGRIAVAFRQNVYLWTSVTGSVKLLCDLSSPSKFQIKDRSIHDSTLATSVKWNYEGNLLSFGTDSGHVLIYDANNYKLIRSLNHLEETFSNVNCIDWASDGTLNGAFDDGTIVEHDLRIKDSKIRAWDGHEGRVESVKSRESSDLLASSGADSLVKVWDRRGGNEPMLKMKGHKASVKALSWCPWEPSILASGGGNKDSRINIWNVSASPFPNLSSSSSSIMNRNHSNDPNPIPIRSIKCQSSITSLIWSNRHRELLSTHGISPSVFDPFSPQQLTSNINLWSWTGGDSKLKMIHSIVNAHGGRCLESSLGPDGQHVASVGMDECLKIWKFFEKREELDLGTGRTGGYSLR